MPNLAGPMLRIEVHHFRGRRISEATVTMKSKDGLDDPGKLLFDADAGAFLLDGFELGSYLLHVTAPGLAAQERHVDLDSGTHREVFILGDPGMHFYYLGTTRVPFEPPPDHIGVTLSPSATEDQIEQVVELGRSLGLVPVEVGKPVVDNRVLVFRGEAEIPDDLKLILQRDPQVRRVGPLIRLDPGGVTILINEIIVQFEQHVGDDESTDVALSLGLRKVRTIVYVPNGYLLRAKPPTSLGLLDVVHTLAADDRVIYAEPNLIITPVNHAGPPGDYLFANQWNLQHILLPEAWDHLHGLEADLKFGRDEIVIAVMDDGIQSETEVLESAPVHPDFAGTVSPSDQPKIYKSFDFLTMRPGTLGAVTDHGYGVAAIATALAGNDHADAPQGEGVVGAAANCRVIAMRRPSGLPQLNYADAYVWAAGLEVDWNTDQYDEDFLLPVLPTQIIPGADVILSGFGTGAPDVHETIGLAFEYITTNGRNGKGTPIFFAAGNGGGDLQLNSAWAAHDRVIAVAASTLADVKAPYSNSGPGVDLCAPSSDLQDGIANGIYSCQAPNSAYGIAGYLGGTLDYTNVFGGTSAAVPLAAGVAALILSVNPDLTWIEVRQILRDTAVKIGPAGSYDLMGHSEDFGYGRVNAVAAVVRAEETLEPPSAADVWIRENLYDVGDVPSLPTGSPDVWVRNASPAQDVPGPAGEHQAPIRGRHNWVWARVRNRGTGPSGATDVRLFVTRWAGTEYVYPEDFIPVGGPLDSDPPDSATMEPGSHLIGVGHLSSVAPGEVLVRARWDAALIPDDRVIYGGVSYFWGHPCLLVDVVPHDGPVSTGNKTYDNNNLCQRNITIVDQPPGQDDFAVAFVVGHATNPSPMLKLRITRTTLSPRVKLGFDYIDTVATNRIQRFFRTHLVPSYGMPTIQYGGRTVFGLPTVNSTDVPILRSPGDYQVVALLGKGLRGAVAGKHVIDVQQYGSRGSLEGAIRIEIRN